PSPRPSPTPSPRWNGPGPPLWTPSSPWRTLSPRWHVPWKEVHDLAPPSRHRRSRPDHRDVPPAPPAIRLRHALRQAASVPGVRGARQGLSAQVRARLLRGGAGAGPRGRAARPGGARPALRAPAGAAAARGEGRPEDRAG